ncbi:MAG: DegT/DnrJ/EryC1/StrS aminotransferase, partial [Candidatus Aenigmarchaeota archaeon]|nr:DegT/DnrJ/EryC1/StrS aminotransferase [Candidatus Aenigmarchaeota archaeon]
ENYIYVVKELSKLEDIRLRQTLENESILGDSLLFTLQYYNLQDIVWFSKALNAEGIQCSAFGNSEYRNIRCFWNWGFLFNNITIEERKSLLPKTSHYLENVIDIPLSPTLEKNDLDDLILSIKKILKKLKEIRNK